MEVKRIRGVIKEYDWGNKEFLPALLQQAEDGKCKAEYWMGTHPSGDAVVSDTGEKLSAFLREHADTYLGQAHEKRWGKDLPLLFKVLAIGKQLSIQCHPTTEQARKGWEKEQGLRKSCPDPSMWDYKDANRKAEVMCALTPVTAMCGFRPYDEMLASLQLLMPLSLCRYFDLSKRGDEGVKTLFGTLYTMDSKKLSYCIGEYLSNLKKSDLPLMSADGLYLESKGIVLACAEDYPHDPGLFCPVLLNVLHLAPQEALFLKPDTLHAYVAGNGIELMSASDNVLRGGLTHKKVDVPELLSLVDFHGGDMEKCGMHDEPDGRIRVMTPTPEFALYRMGQGTYQVRQDTVELLLCTEGEAKLTSGDAQVVLKKGECWVKAASVGSYRLEVCGMLFSATVGEA